MTCPYATTHINCETVMGCEKATEKTGTSVYVYPCPERSYEGDYTKCPFYYR